jgi:hypothetical protein
MESSYGLMEDPTKVTGSTASNMVKASMSLLRVLRNTESGRKARESDGLAGMKMSESEHLINTNIDDSGWLITIYL